MDGCQRECLLHDAECRVVLGQGGTTSLGLWVIGSDESCRSMLNCVPSACVVQSKRPTLAVASDVHWLFKITIYQPQQNSPACHMKHVHRAIQHIESHHEHRPQTGLAVGTRWVRVERPALPDESLEGDAASQPSHRRSPFAIHPQASWIGCVQWAAGIEPHHQEGGGAGLVLGEGEGRGKEVHVAQRATERGGHVRLVLSPTAVVHQHVLLVVVPVAGCVDVHAARGSLGDVGGRLAHGPDHLVVNALQDNPRPPQHRALEQQCSNPAWVVSMDIRPCLAHCLESLSSGTYAMSQVNR